MNDLKIDNLDDAVRELFGVAEQAGRLIPALSMHLQGSEARLVRNENAMKELRSMGLASIETVEIQYVTLKVMLFSVEPVLACKPIKDGTRWRRLLKIPFHLVDIDSIGEGNG